MNDSKANRRLKLKLAFEELEKSYEVLSPQEQTSCSGGYSGFVGLRSQNDCAIHAIAFANGQSYSDVLSAFGQWSVGQSGWFSDANYNASAMQASGMYMSDIASFATHMGLNNAGDTPHGPNGMSMSGDQSIVLTHDGFSGHVRVLTGNASATHYYYYNPQTGTTGTIAKTDSTIRGTFGY